MLTAAILSYHSVDDSGSVISVHPDLFRRQMEFLASQAVPVVPLREITRARPALALTFDDAYGNFLDAALPVLVRYRLPATVFVVSGFCGRTNDWYSPPRLGIPKLRLMDWGAIRDLPEDLVALGAHTVTHPDLTALPEQEAAAEIRICRVEIEDRTGRPADSFAYPYGSTNRSVSALAGREFHLACGMAPGFLNGRTAPLHLPRIDVDYLRRQFWFERLASGTGQAYVGARRWMRALREACAAGPASRTSP